MSTSTSSVNSLVPAIVDQAVNQAKQCNQADALKTLTSSYDLTHEQTTKIRSILGAFQPNISSSGLGLKQEILAILKSGTLENGQVVSQNEDVFISFLNSLTSVFANDYPCRFKFEGKYYPNATVCILAQQYTDQPDMVDLFIQCETTKEALTLAELTPMTLERKKHINQLDVLMHVLREKFGQNPELKNQLVATGYAFLDCQDNDLFLSGIYNQSILGGCLMQLRGEYSGMGIVQPGNDYLSSIESASERCHLVANELFSDIIHQISSQCLSADNFEGLFALAYVNTHWNQCSKTFWAKYDLKQLCPPGLNILDAKAQGFEIDDEPFINTFAILKSFKELAPFVECDAGLTLLTMRKGLTMNQLVKIAKEKGMSITDSTMFLQDQGDIPVKRTYRVLITNSIFIESRDGTSDEQRRLCVSEHGCEIPTAREYFALCVLTYALFGKRMYMQNSQFGKKSRTYARSSTLVEGRSLTVGGGTGFRPSCHTSYQANDYADECCGAGGQRKF